MRIWIISSSYPRRPDEAANAGVLARDLALEYVARGHEVHVLTPAKPGRVVFDSQLRGREFPWWKPSLTTSDLETSTLRGKVRAASLILSGVATTLWEAARGRPDRIIALWAIPSGVFAWVAWKVLRVPYVVWMLGSDVWRADEFPFGNTVLRLVSEGSESAYADGLSLADQASLIARRPVQFLLSTRRLPTAKVDGEPVPSIVFIGRFHPNKGPDVLLQALSHLDEPTDAVLFGSGELGESLAEAVIRSGVGDSVRIAAPISAEEVHRVLKGCRVLVVPSRIESIPLVLGDAVQAGTPVVVTDVGDMADIVRRYGLGLVVPPEDPREMARAIESALEGDLPKRRDLEARDLFSFDRIAVSLVDPLREEGP